LQLARPFLAAFFALSASLANFLVHDGYPVLRLEAALAYAVLAGVAAVFALLHAGSRPWVRRVLEGLLVAFAVDLNFSNGLAAAAAGIVAFAVGFRLKERLASLIAVFSAIVLAATLAGAGDTRQWLTHRHFARNEHPQRNDLPAVVHILFDEHLGIDGFAQTQQGEAVRNELLGTYRRNGFAVFSGAYSQHMHTINAIPSILNFDSRGPRSGDRDGASVGRTRYFERLRALGYRLTVFQSSYAEFCENAGAAECVTYDKASLVPLDETSLGIADRATIMLVNWLNVSSSVNWFGRRYQQFAQLAQAGGVTVPAYQPQRLQTASTTSLAVAREVVARARTLKPGEALFFHALLPHYPYATDPGCRVKPLKQWKWRLQAGRVGDTQAAYADQVRCVARLAGEVVDALNQSPARGDFAVVVHGDHGSRINLADPKSSSASVNQRDLISSFSTLFAVRTAGGEPAANGPPAVAGRYRAADLLENVSRRQFRGFDLQAPESAPTVYLDDADWQPGRRIALPAF
jgi:hypothetical protein